MPQTRKNSETSSPERKADLPGLSPVETVDPRIDVVAFRDTDEGKELTAWANDEFSRCRTAKLPKQRQWYINLAMVFGKQWLSVVNGTTDQSMNGRLKVSQAPKYLRRKTINRLRSFVRTECSKFQSTLPNIVSVPSTAEDEDVRAAYAGEQVWMSYSETKRFRRQYNMAIWWMVMTGVGFVKTWWDPSIPVEVAEGREDIGDIEFRKVNPFNIFVPELRESEVDDQPYIIEARVRTLEWVKEFYKDKLEGVKLSPSTSSANTVLDEGYLSLQDAKTSVDSVVVKEFWVKPGTTKHLPEGGFFVMVEDVLVDYYEGLPYKHGQFPYTKIDHMFNDTFFADSPLVDLIELQKEYNEIRTDIGVAARRMGNPQLLVAKGSIATGKLTNEPGAMIEYRPGLPQPQPAPMAQLPQYVLDQLDRILMDMEDISGQHEVSRGQAPTGVTAGTALAYLGERDDNYLTPQYQGVEDAIQRIARQTLMLFQEYVDIERKIKVVGLDGAYDTLLLDGADIKNGTDVRVEPGTAIGQSQAAKQQQVYDLVSLGLIDQATALKMLELGGPQKVLDIMSAAERKAQRENMKMKALKGDLAAIETHNQEFMDQALQQLPPMPPEQLMALLPEIQGMLPPFVPVDDFDIHEMHIETHNRFRMSQEYETLPDEVKDQFEKHVQWHQQMGGMQMQEQLLAQMPPEVAAQDQQQIAGPEQPESASPEELSATMAPMPDMGIGFQEG